ncbi:unnamed protein product [Lepidochelys kempii]
MGGWMDERERDGWMDKKERRIDKKGRIRRKEREEGGPEPETGQRSGGRDGARPRDPHGAGPGRSGRTRGRRGQAPRAKPALLLLRRRRELPPLPARRGRAGSGLQFPACRGAGAGFRALSADSRFRCRRASRAGAMKLFALAVFALLSVAHSEEGARLLASKSLLNRYAVEGKDLTLQYNIYNVGSSAALDVELSDDSFPPEDFGIVSGMLNVKWDRIAPASNVSHTVVLRPLKAGYFNFTSATITYLAQEGGQVVVGFTSAPGQGGILAQREFDRRFSPHFLDWAAFGVMTLPSIGIPLLLWYSSKRKYDTPKTKKN